MEFYRDSESYYLKVIPKYLFRILGSETGILQLSNELRIDSNSYQ